MADDTFRSIWDEPVDGDDSTAAAGKRKKHSWWDEFEREPAKTETTSAERYSYRDAFDDSDSRWYRKNSFSYGKYDDYSPSRLFRSTFMGFGSGSYFNTYSTSADNEVKNKAVRALRVLTRNANTVADKAAKISYIVSFSDGMDTNQPIAEGVKGKSGKQQEQIIFISPDAIEKASSPDEDDAAVDALTGFVLLRVQIAQSVPKNVLDELNNSSMNALPAKIAAMVSNKTLSTLEAAKTAASSYTDEYSAGLIAKNLLTRLARRGVVRDWGGFAPYFVRHAKKFAAIREKLTEAGAVESVELLSAQIAYNMLADDNPVPLTKDIEEIVERHLSAELKCEEVLPACCALVTDLRNHLASKTEQPVGGALEQAMTDLFAELANKNANAASAAAVENGMRNNLEDMASLLDRMAETAEQNSITNRFQQAGAEGAKVYNATAALGVMEALREEIAATIAAICALKLGADGKTPRDPKNYANDLRYRQAVLDSTMAHWPKRCPELTKKYAINSEELRLANNPVNTTSAESIEADANKYVDKLKNTVDKLNDAIKAEISELREKLQAVIEELAARIPEEEKQLQKLSEKAAEIAESTAKLADSHESGPIVDRAAQRLASGLQDRFKALSDLQPAARNIPKLKRLRTSAGLRKMAGEINRMTATAGEAVDRAINLVLDASAGGPGIMQNFIRCGRHAYQNERTTTRSIIKMPDQWHKSAIDDVMEYKAPQYGDFTANVLSAAHKELLNKLIKKLTNNGNRDMPGSMSGEEMPADHKEALKRVAASLGMEARNLLRLLQEINRAERTGHVNIQASKLGKDIESRILQLAEANSPVDEELFGKQVSNTTKMLDGTAIGGVNEEALNRAEEEFVAFLSHNNARPMVKVKKAPKRGADVVARTTAIKKRNRVAIENVRNALQFQSNKRVGEVHGLLSGDLDEGSLHKLRYDSEHIWSQKTIAKLPDVAVGILVDQSGSMSSGGKIESARELCIVLAEALKQINGVHLHVYGHTANQSSTSDLTLFEHYSSYGDASAADLSNLGAIAAYANNYDGYAIKEAAKRLNQDPAKKKYLFIIADGFPAGSGYGGQQADKHVTSVCSYVRTKLDIATYAFAVGNNSASEQRRFEAQYGKTNVVFISTVKQALPKIVRFLRNALQKEKTLVDIGAD